MLSEKSVLIKEYNDLINIGHSQRSACANLQIPRTTMQDWLRDLCEPAVHKKYKSDIVQVETSKHGGKTHIFLPDAQVRPGISLDYLKWQGKYVASKMPDVIVCAGDFADMASLSSYDKGKRSAEGKRVQADIDSAIEGMNALLRPIRQQQIENPSWKPYMALTLGNHERRLMRHVEANPELEGLLSYANLRYEEMGWDVFDYLEPVVIDGITYIHYFPNPMSGKPYGGNAANILQKVGMSVTQGHRQCLDVATRTLHDGRHQWSIIAGSSYLHDESYKGYTGNKHWRGIIVKHNVSNGSYDPLFVSMDYLQERYGTK